MNAAEGRTYSLSLRGPGYEPWKPVVGFLLLVVGFFAVQAAFFVVPAITVAIDHEGSYPDALEKALDFEQVTWHAMLYLNLSLASLVLVTWGIVRFLHQLRPATLASVAPGIRWRFLWACFGIAVVALAAQVIVGSFVPGDPNNLDASTNELTTRLTGILIVVVLTTPLQAIGEEYAFRGYLMQAFGSLSGLPWIGIGLSALLFAIAHGYQNVPLFLDRFAFGLMAGYVVHRTGGLEAGIAMHVWNNLLAFGFAIFLGDIDDTLTVTEVSWWNIPLTITQNGVYLLLVIWLARRMGVRRTTPPVSDLPPPPPGSSPVLLPTRPHV